ncbi:VOC family protein [Euzebya tangerina]|uniref:VOC family protein n=1 Tax=Euzebya tangerina TaxID=591198 RepID=UPI0013C324E3|nr:VOC family protein [Euzebya tangerina]
MTTLDHIFVATETDGGVHASALEEAGLVPSYRRRHVGQGTANICYALDDVFIELLWLVDEAEVTSAAVAPTALGPRVARQDGTCPFGVAVRGSGPSAPTFAWAPTFLPDGMTLPVAEASRDPALPLVFASPGTAGPAEWTDGRAGARQTAAGLTHCQATRLDVPSSLVGHPLLASLAGDVGAEILPADGWRLSLEVASTAGPTRTIELWADGARVS